MLKSFLLLTLLVPAFASASSDNMQLTCVGETFRGDIVELTACLDGAQENLVACYGSGAGYVKIRKEHWADIPKQTPPIIEQLEIPARFFSYQHGVEEGFSLNLEGDVVWQVSVESAGNAPVSMTIDANGITNSFKKASCAFEPIHHINQGSN